MKGIEIQPCCAVCELLYNCDFCPLYWTYHTAEEYSNGNFEENAKYVVCCNVFKLNQKFVSND